MKIVKTGPGNFYVFENVYYVMYIANFLNNICVQHLQFFCNAPFFSVDIPLWHFFILLTNKQYNVLNIIL